MKLDLDEFGQSIVDLILLARGERKELEQRQTILERQVKKISIRIAAVQLTRKMWQERQGNSSDADQT